MQKIKQDLQERQNPAKFKNIAQNSIKSKAIVNSLKNAYYDENSMRLEIYLKATNLPEKHNYIQILMKQPKQLPNFSEQNLTSQSKSKKSSDHINSQITSKKKFSQQLEEEEEQDDDIFVVYHKTEVIYDNSSPFFQETFKVDYVFSIEQYIRFELYSVSSIGSFKTKKIGQCETTLGNILGQEDFIWESKLQENEQGQIIVKAENLILSDKYIELEWQVKNVVNPRIQCFGKKPNLYLKYFRFDRGDNKNSFLLKESEVKRHCLNADFQPIEFNYGRICSAQMENPIKLELWDAQRNNSHKKIGEIMFSMQEIFEIGNKSFILRKTAKNYKENQKNNNNPYKGEIILKSSRIFQKSHFLDYLQAGTQICLITAMDFCTQDINLRYRSADKKHFQGSLYDKALKTVSSVLLNYDSDKKVPMYGLCGVPVQNNQYSEMLPYFQLNPNQLEANGMEEIIEFYQTAIKNTKLGNQLLFGPIIQEVRQICQKAVQEENNNQYYVLLVLTDGDINDMEETKKQIIKSCDLPISIIFVGLSYPHEDSQKKFEYMEILDGDQGLFDSDGNQASRDMVKFVNYAKYSYNKRVLSSQILDQLPQQFCEYMEKKYSKKQDFIIKINGQQQQDLNNSQDEQKSIVFNIQDESLANNIPRKELLRMSINEINNVRQSNSRLSSIQSPEKIIINKQDIKSHIQQQQNNFVQQEQEEINSDSNSDSENVSDNSQNLHNESIRHSQLNSQRSINQNNNKNKFLHKQSQSQVIKINNSQIQQ